MFHVSYDDVGAGYYLVQLWFGSVLLHEGMYNIGKIKEA